jgi:protein phosphatase
VCDDERDQRFQTQAFALLHCLIEQRLSINRLCVVDSTALTQSARQALLELARRYHVPAVVLLLDVPLETCLAHDAKRERTVGQAVIERQHQLFQQAKAAVKQEGFDQVVELTQEDMEKAQIEIIFRPVPRPTTNAAPPERRRYAPRPPRPAAGNKGAPRSAKPPPPPSEQPPS